MKIFLPFSFTQGPEKLCWFLAIPASKHLVDSHAVAQPSKSLVQLEAILSYDVRNALLTVCFPILSLSLRYASLRPP